MQPTFARYVYGIDPATGMPLQPPTAPPEIVAALDPQQPSNAVEDEPEAKELGEHERERRTRRLAIAGGANPEDLSKVGWAVIFPQGADPRVVAALQPLVEHRRSEAGPLLKVFAGTDGLRRNEDAPAFRTRLQVSGLVEPSKLPYHLLLVGDPVAIPFEFERSFGAQYSVGRIDLPAPEAYARYASAVVAHETALRDEAQLRFFATAHPGDEATQTSRKQLVDPLAAHYGASGADVAVGSAALKPALLNLWTSGQGPRLVLSATHGLGCQLGNPEQFAIQGGLVCQEWAGPGSGHVKPGQFVRAEDLHPGLDLTGTLAFTFGCYTTGTPLLDRFWLIKPGGEDPRFAVKRLAPIPFTASLAKALLSHPKPALAMIGHVDEAYTTAFMWPGVKDATSSFREVIDGIRRGGRIGHALRVFIEAAAQYRYDFEQQRDDRRIGIPTPDEKYAWTWLASRDGSAYAIFGDPAIRLVARARS
jgi:hypothetical protein